MICPVSSSLREGAASGHGVWAPSSPDALILKILRTVHSSLCFPCLPAEFWFPGWPDSSSLSACRGCVRSVYTVLVSANSETGWSTTISQIHSVCARSTNNLCFKWFFFSSVWFVAPKSSTRNRKWRFLSRPIILGKIKWQFYRGKDLFLMVLVLNVQWWILWRCATESC